MNMTKAQAKKVQEIIESFGNTSSTYETVIIGDTVVVIESFSNENAHFQGRKDSYTINHRGGLKIQSWVR